MYNDTLQQLTIEHKKIPKTTSQTKVVGNSEESVVENKREASGQTLALTRKVFRLEFRYILCGIWFHR
jgi:hypothetical protein